MEVKKSAKANLEKGKSLSILMGLVVALSILFVSFEWGTKDIQVAAYEGMADIIAEEEIEITIPEDTPPPPPPPPAPVVVEELQIVDDDVDIAPVEIMSTEDTPSSSQPEIYMPPVEEEEEAAGNYIHTIVERMPQFPGGDAEMLKFVNRNIRYPVIAQENGIYGRVVCTFVIDKEGKVTNIEVARGVDPSLDKEAIRVIGTMPTWSPGMQGGKPVNVRYTLPVVFRLQ